MQNDLESIKDFFKNDDFSLDHNAFMGVSKYYFSFFFFAFDYYSKISYHTKICIQL